jgi:hypothetical protein
VYKNRNGVIYVVKSIEDLISVVIPLFDNSPLRDGKLESYLNFRKVVLMMKDKKHLSLEGLLEIIDIAYFMNKDTTLRSKSSKSDLKKDLELKYGILPSLDSNSTNLIQVTPSKPKLV